MKWSSLLSWLLLIVQLGLLASTAFIAPVLLRPRLFTYIVYSVLVAVVWVGYMLGATFFDGKVGNDVPGIGYLLIGFIGWLVGSAVFGSRARKAGNE